MGARARPRQQRRDAAEEEGAAGFGRRGSFYQVIGVSAHRGGGGARGEGRSRDATPAQSLRVRKRASRLAARAVAASAELIAGGWRGESFQQEWRRTRCVARADGAVSRRGGLRAAPGDGDPGRAAPDESATLLRA